MLSPASAVQVVDLAGDQAGGASVENGDTELAGEVLVLDVDGEGSGHDASQVEEAEAGAPLSAVAGHLGDTVETVSRTYVHWLRDDRDIPAQVLDRMLSPASSARHGASGTGT